MDGEEDQADEKRKQIEVPSEMVTELAVLNDLDISDEEMLFHMRQFIATFAKRIQETSQDTKETRIKLETAFKKTEDTGNKVSSTRQSIVDIMDKLKLIE